MRITLIDVTRDESMPHRLAVVSICYLSLFSASMILAGMSHGWHIPILIYGSIMPNVFIRINMCSSNFPTRFRNNIGSGPFSISTSPYPYYAPTISFERFMEKFTVSGTIASLAVSSGYVGLTMAVSGADYSWMIGLVLFCCVFTVISLIFIPGSASEES